MWLLMCIENNYICMLAAIDIQFKNLAHVFVTIYLLQIKNLYSCVIIEAMSGAL